MTFPPSPPSTVTNYYYEDPTTGKGWTYDSGVWTPSEVSVMNDLTDVIAVTDGTSASTTVGQFPQTGTNTHVLSGSNAFGRFELQSGVDFVLEEIVLESFSKSAADSSLSVTLEVFDGVALPPFTQSPVSLSDLNTIRQSLGPAKYSSTVSYAQVTSTSFGSITFPFTGDGIIQRGKFTALLTVSKASGTFTYKGNFDDGFTVKGKPCLTPPSDASLLEFKGSPSVTTDFTAFPTPSPYGTWSINGTATLDGVNNWYVLTNNAANDVGWITHNLPIPKSAWNAGTTTGFNAYFVVSSTSVTPGDPGSGWSFNLYDWATSTDTSGGNNTLLGSDGSVYSIRFNYSLSDTYTVFRNGASVTTPRTVDSAGSTLNFFGERAYRVHLYRDSSNNYYLDTYYGTQTDYSDLKLIYSYNMGNTGLNYFTGNQDFRLQFAAGNGTRVSQVTIKEAKFNYYNEGLLGGQVWNAAPVVSSGVPLVQSAVDPTVSDLSTHTFGTFWVNTTTKTLFIKVYDVVSSAVYWQECPKGLEIDTNPMIVPVFLAVADPVLARGPFAQGDMMITPSNNTLWVYDGTSWTQA